MAATTFYTPSDSRLKINIQSFTPVLDRVKKIEPVQFQWKNNGKPDYGFIAQQFFQEFDFLHDAHNYHGEDSPKTEKGDDIFYSMEYQKITAILCKALQELEEKHQNDITTLKTQINELENRLNNLESK